TMLLHTLEIKGFKSFGDKVTFVFDEGVTAIVGPNGSGKSNVVDAIRWVLGEQSMRTLRSDKMDNIIFNGTKHRKPLQMAEVSLSFKNTKNLLPTEYTEVTITRRFYRSGESEYLLNGIPCRLKDINDLFMDTGIGPDSYAIIELKMIDSILNDHENARREMLEEAAGIAKFKKRKKETLKKLADTDADLERVEDLLAEIEKNMRSLERQAKQAEKYLKTKELYKKASLSLARRSVVEWLDRLAELQRRIEQETDLREQCVAQLATLEANLEDEKRVLIEKEKLLASRQKALNEQVHRIRQYESDKKIRHERLKMLNDR
ncbi:MAG: AAA family ATPase, partial [Flammeovirgaceae bacterium]|nr:AAA family ATPase [Flammeovirgaceae bacterium]